MPSRPFSAIRRSNPQCASNPQAVRILERYELRANQYVLSGGRAPGDNLIAERSTRSDVAGIARLPLTSQGHWYVKFIHMTPTPGDTVDYESKWATLTFEVRRKIERTVGESSSWPPRRGTTEAHPIDFSSFSTGE